MLKVIEPVPVVLLPILVAEAALPIGFVVTKIAFKNVAIFMVENAEAMRLSKAPVTRVPGAISPLLAPMALFKVADFGDLTGVQRFIRHVHVYHIVNVAHPHAVKLSKRRCVACLLNSVGV